MDTGAVAPSVASWFETREDALLTMREALFRRSTADYAFGSNSPYTLALPSS
jgi:hypothetical protein